MESNAFLKSAKHNIMYSGCWCSAAFCNMIRQFVT